MIKRLLTTLYILFQTLLCVGLSAQTKVDFHRLSTHDGLSNSQVNCIFKDSRGFLWFGTQSGLNRFDGFRFKTYLCKNNDPKSLPNNVVEEIQEDVDGNLWLRTPLGYAVFTPKAEVFAPVSASWMRSRGMRGTPSRVFIDARKNMWLAVNGQGLYFYDVKSGRAVLFPQKGKGPLALNFNTITWLSAYDGGVLVSMSDGRLACVDGLRQRVVWRSDYVSRKTKGATADYRAMTDAYGNIWYSYQWRTECWSRRHHRWFTSVYEFLRSEGCTLDLGDFEVKNVVTDHTQTVWIATDHHGLVAANLKNKTFRSYQFDSADAHSLPDNTVQCLYVDNLNALWLGCYKNGVAYYSPASSRFSTVTLGDVCTIVEDRSGNYWCGTNDRGIVVYNPVTGIVRRYGMAQTGLGSDVVISSAVDKDGSLWFGSFNGGLTHYKDGVFKAFKVGDGSGLASDNIWHLAVEEATGNLVIATLGGGLQILGKESGRFMTFNTRNSKLPTDYLSSLSFDTRGNLLIGNATDLSLMNMDNHRITTRSATRSGQVFVSSAINQVFVDSRGLIWNATASGATVYDPHTDQLETLDLSSGLLGAMACSVTEDFGHAMWIASDHGVSHVTVSREEGKWSFFVTSYNDIDGLQSRQFNLRSIYLASNGNVIVGGQDGINIIPPQKIKTMKSQPKALFSGLMLFDHLMTVGEPYHDRVVLEEALRDGGVLELAANENAFTILLAGDNVMIPEKSRFLYRLKGFSDKWLMTSEDRPSVTFTNLSATTYELEVKVVNRDGRVSDKVSRLTIKVRPPFYLSTWAIWGYVLLLLIGLYYIKWLVERRQRVKYRMEQVEFEAAQKIQLDELKLNFFTNVSHELRTPLSLIISPLEALIGKETDKAKADKLQLVHRNALRLLNMVNEILDFRKMDKEQLRLHVLSGDIVEFIRNICVAFQEFGGHRVALTFYSSVESLMMSFDDDKIRKVMNNLLSNAFKFTDDGGRIDVALRVLKSQVAESDMLEIKVSDTGVGISDKDKAHIFDRFYQVDQQRETPYGGSGIGLNLVKSFIELHGGEVAVADNPGGGTVFVVTIPVRHDATEGKSGMASLETARANLLLSPSADVVAPSASSVVMPAKADRQRHDVLIVDDSDDFRAFMCDVLADQFDVRAAANGKEALRKIAEKKPDVILSDVMMPEMDGNELCRQVKSDRATCDIPFIMLTARVAQEQEIEGMEMGADDYITKPFNLDLLQLRIANLIKWKAGGGGSSKLQPKIKQEEITSLDEKLVKDATDYVENNLDNSDISVEALSAELGMSRVQMYKKLVAITGTTPSEFIRLIRLKHAEQLLRQSQLSVSEIAYRVGFNNPRYFSKYFIDMYGLTPSQYKKRYEGK
ncbi:hybrid sensor histidine kinase/response regulator transcription factor [Prevotella sp.]|uniref:hybrid sensor histidine kinase/response regulator transcription factor n=1 Tax=Prevotella sp. TaxID=59823 RepID=UPI002F94C58D